MPGDSWYKGGVGTSLVGWKVPGAVRCSWGATGAVALVPRSGGQQRMPFYPTSRSKQAPNDSDEQLFLPLAIKHAPREVREHGLQEIHSFPLVSRGKGYAVTRKPAHMAWRRYQEIELRTPNSFPALIFDVDTLPLNYLSVAFGVTVRPPNWIVSNPETGHAHIVYCLDRPVLHGDGMREKPLKWRQRIAEFYRMVYKGGSRLCWRPDAQPGASQVGNDVVAGRPLDVAGAGRGYSEGLADPGEADDAGGP